MNNEALDSLRSQVNTTYCIVTRTYDAAGNMTGESRAEHPEPTIRLTHDQGVQLLALINKLKSESVPITHESAIDFLRNEGWLQKHDKMLTPVMVMSKFNNMCNMTFHYCGACGDSLPISAKRAKFCPWCGRPVKWDD